MVKLQHKDVIGLAVSLRLKPRLMGMRSKVSSLYQFDDGCCQVVGKRLFIALFRHAHQLLSWNFTVDEEGKDLIERTGRRTRIVEVGKENGKRKWPESI